MSNPYRVLGLGLCLAGIIFAPISYYRQLSSAYGYGDIGNNNWLYLHRFSQYPTLHFPRSQSTNAANWYGEYRGPSGGTWAQEQGNLSSINNEGRAAIGSDTPRAE